MTKYKLSSQATQDLSGIADYSIEKWGILLARRYRTELDDCFMKLANHPTMGRDASEFAPNLKLYPHKPHTIFYEINDNGILIIRILGSRMDLKQHL